MLGVDERSDDAVRAVRADEDAVGVVVGDLDATGHPPHRRGDGGVEGAEQVAARDQQARRHRQLEQAPSAGGEDREAVDARHAAQRGVGAHLLERRPGLGPHGERRPRVGQARPLLVHRDVEPPGVQRRGEREPGDAAAHDRDPGHGVIVRRL